VTIEHDSTRLSADDLYLFNEGTHRTLATKLGAHFLAGVGTSFAVWAPNARSVTVMGDFNYWNPENFPLSPRGSSGIWEAVVAEAKLGDVYKYVVTADNGTPFEKADPFALCSEVPPRTGSVIWDLR